MTHSHSTLAKKIAKLTCALLWLDVSYNPCLSNEGLDAILQANASMTSLNVSWCDQLTALPALPDAMEHLDASHCSRLPSDVRVSSRLLTALSLSHTPVSVLTLECPALTALILSHCIELTAIRSPTPLTKATLLSLASCCHAIDLTAFPCLLQLDLSQGCVPDALPLTLRSLTVDDCPALPRCLAQLSHLTNFSMSNVPFRAESFPFLPSVVMLIAQRCASVPPLGCFMSLNVLDLSWCNGVTAAVLESLPSSLTIFRAYGCRFVRRADLDALGKRVEGLAIYHNADE